MEFLSFVPCLLVLVLLRHRGCRHSSFVRLFSLDPPCWRHRAGFCAQFQSFLSHYSSVIKMLMGLKFECNFSKSSYERNNQAFNHNFSRDKKIIHTESTLRLWVSQTRKITLCVWCHQQPLNCLQWSLLRHCRFSWLRFSWPFSFVCVLSVCLLWFQRPIQNDNKQLMFRKYIWASSWDYGTYHIGDQRRLRRTCASAESRQSLRCSHAWRMEIDEGSDQKSDI